MLPYWLLFGLFAAGSGIEQPDPLRRERLGLLWIGAVVIILLVGLRDNVGVDYANYLRAWNLAGVNSFDAFFRQHAGDPAFYFIMWSFRNTGLPYWALNLFCAVIFTWGIVRFARTLPNPWLGLAVAVPYLVIVIAMSAIRQATAIGFIFIALVAFSRKETLGFLAWTAIAASFHASAVIILFLVGVSFARTRFEFIFALLISALLAYLIVGSTIGENSYGYLDRYALQSSGTTYRVVMSVIPALLYLKFRHRMILTSHEERVWRNFSFFAILSIPLIFLIRSSTVIDRLLLYAFPLQMLTLSWLPSLFKGASARFLITLGIIIYLTAQLYIFLIYGVNSAAYLPYRSFLFSVI